MKILWVKAGKLWPVDTGGKIRSVNILRHLGRKHEVTNKAVVYGGDRDAEYEADIAQEYRALRPSTLPLPRAGWRNRSIMFCVCLLRLPMP